MGVRGRGDFNCPLERIWCSVFPRTERQRSPSSALAKVAGKGGVLKRVRLGRRKTKARMTDRKTQNCCWAGKVDEDSGRERVKHWSFRTPRTG